MQGTLVYNFYADMKKNIKNSLTYLPDPYYDPNHNTNRNRIPNTNHNPKNDRNLFADPIPTLSRT